MFWHRSTLVTLFCLLSLPSVVADEPQIPHVDNLQRHEKPPRKVVVGTTMTRWYSDYPGLDARLLEMHRLVNELYSDALTRYGKRLDLAVFTEYAVTAGKIGTAEEVAVSLTEDVLAKCAEIAQKHHCNLVFGGIFNDHPTIQGCTNEAVVIDRDGRLVGRYVKVHPVLDGSALNAPMVLEGGVQPGEEFNVFDLDFGRVGIQICYDAEYPEGWETLAKQGAELVLYPTQSPQLTRPAMYAAMNEYWVVSSSYRHNASFFEPGTGLVAAQITDSQQTLVYELDLSYIILPWSSNLRNGAAFAEKFGSRVGYRYSESEDRGVFWSNDPSTNIGEMAAELNLLEAASTQQSRAREAQDQVRGKRPR